MGRQHVAEGFLDGDRAHDCRGPGVFQGSHHILEQFRLLPVGAYAIINAQAHGNLQLSCGNPVNAVDDFQQKPRSLERAAAVSVMAMVGPGR